MKRLFLTGVLAIVAISGAFASKTFANFTFFTGGSTQVLCSDTPDLSCAASSSNGQLYTSPGQVNPIPTADLDNYTFIQ